MAETHPIASMTGFARRHGGDDVLAWTWEMRSVNGRTLDLRCRLPAGFEALDPAARGLASRYCARGNLQLGLTVDRQVPPTRLRVNRELLDQLVALIAELSGTIDAAAPRLDGLLAMRGVIEVIEEEEPEERRAAREAAMVADLEQVFAALVAVRRSEGARLAALVESHLTAIDGLVEEAAATTAAQPEALRERLRLQLEELLQTAPALPEERLAQEAAVLISKSDVREELDRLRAHVAAAHELLVEGRAVGRRLDFLCQEFNREANTLCAKSPDVALTRLGLALKNAVEQLREQVQNIE